MRCLGLFATKSMRKFAAPKHFGCVYTFFTSHSMDGDPLLHTRKTAARRNERAGAWLLGESHPALCS